MTLSITSANLLDLEVWLGNVFKSCGDFDPRSGTIWLSPELYPTRRSLFDDYKTGLPEHVKAPSRSSFYSVRKPGNPHPLYVSPSENCLISGSVGVHAVKNTTPSLRRRHLVFLYLTPKQLHEQVWSKQYGHVKMPKSISFAACDTCVTLKDYKRLSSDERARAFWSESLRKHREDVERDRRKYMSIM